ncbi:MAG: hypothetical protein JNN03_08560 [Rubrivivax sp.]|nr:hypothetical protein [Rubrivivax sp.]
MRPDPLSSTPPAAVDFRLPGEVVRRAFLQHTAVIVGVLVLYHLLTQQASLGALAGGAALAVLVLAVAYAATAHRTWITLSPAGLSSTGYTGRKLELPWTMPVQVTASRRSGHRGHAIAQPSAGFLRTSMSAVFVPLAISTSPEFVSRVAAWAPAGHPLRAVVSKAA